MTSYTTPSGKASASSEVNSVNLAWKTFDQDSNSYWYGNSNDSAAWLKYEFPHKTNVTKMSINWYSFSAGSTPNITIKLQGSNDDITWTDLDTSVIAPLASASHRILDYTIYNNGFYKYYRLLFDSVHFIANTYGLSPAEWQMGGKELIV